jgi:hypothetical protein
MQHEQTDDAVFTITMSKDGEFHVTDEKGRELQERGPDELGKTLIGREIREAKSVTITYLRSNPGWVCIGGHWYYIP